MLGDRFWWRLFSLCSVLLFLVIGARLIHLQVVQGSFYVNFVKEQSEVQLSFTKDRGVIYDRVGRPLAQNRKVASLYTFGKNVDDPAAFVAMLKKNGLDITPGLEKKLASTNGFVWIKRQIDVALARKLKDQMDNLGFYIEDARFYPEGELMAGIVGYTGVDNQGLAGVEYFKDSILKGRSFPVNVMKDSGGRLILFDDGVLKTGPDTSISLTIDVRLQALAENILKQDLKEFRARKAVVVAMDVVTGEILLSLSAEDTKKRVIKNDATTYLFEPGSIFKAVSFSYLIENGQYKPNAVVKTGTPYQIHGHTIRDVSSYPTLTQAEVFTKSSNIGTVTLTSGFNREAFYKYLTLCGFGRKTGIDGSSEETGLLRKPSAWSGLSLASISIGQEVMVSPVQIVRFYAAIANRGYAPEPAIISHTTTGGENSRRKATSERIMSEKTAMALREMLVSTVQTGTGRRARSEIVSIGGKTGTGQMIDKATGTYSKTDYTASFAGIFPAENPKIAMVVLFEAPKASIYGGTTGAETFRKIAEQLAFYYNIGSDNTKVLYAHR